MSQIIINGNQTSAEVTEALNNNYSDLLGENTNRDCVISSGITEDGWIYNIWNSGYTELWTTVISRDDYMTQNTLWNNSWTKPVNVTEPKSTTNPNITCDYRWLSSGKLNSIKKYPVTFREVPFETSTVHAKQNENSYPIYQHSSSYSRSGENTTTHSASYKPFITSTHSMDTDITFYVDISVKGFIDIKENLLAKKINLGLIQEMPSCKFLQVNNNNFDVLYKMDNSNYIKDIQTLQVTMSSAVEGKDLTGQWLFRKWKTGLVELWGNFYNPIEKKDYPMSSTVKIGGTAPRHVLPYSVQIPYPASINFLDRPLEIVNLGLDKNSWSSWMGTGLNSQTVTGSYYLVNGSSNPSYNLTPATAPSGYQMSFYVVGMTQG